MGTEPQFIGSEGRNNEDTTFTSIVMRQLQKTIDAGSVEFHGGYMQTHKKPVGGAVVVTETYKPDTAKTFMNSISRLKDLLLPHFDEKMREEDENIQNEIDAAKTRKEQLAAHTKLFQSLSHFLKRKKYFEV